MRRIRPLLAERNQTFRALVIDALDAALRETPRVFKLRDASAGPATRGRSRVSARAVNKAIDGLREQDFTP